MSGGPPVASSLDSNLTPSELSSPPSLPIPTSSVTGFYSYFPSMSSLGSSPTPDTPLSPTIPPTPYPYTGIKDSSSFLPSSSPGFTPTMGVTAWALRDRLKLSLSEDEARSFVDSLIDSSCCNICTRLYDR